ncbi:efflux RND transporter permease subunit [Brevibacillus ginsengisoli]|uniref:efflux RND transporter permease subunit n=1 Tax=Brevibacillus ginsengisoli TaxID=363854 RepID=UPI003CEDB748
MIKWKDESIRKRVALLLLFFLLFAGVTAGVKMNTAVYPDEGLPSFQIQTSAHGLLPFDVNEQITMTLEEAVRQIGEIEKITSVSRMGSSSIMVKVKANNLDSWKSKLEKQIQAVSKRLPVSASDIQVIQNNLQTSEMAYYFLHGTDLNSLNEVAEFQVKNRLEQILGVSKVEVESQSVENKTEIVFRPSMLQTYAITPSEIISQLRGQGERKQIGEVGEGSDKTYIQWVNAPEQPQELGKLPISTSKGYVLLKQLADIRDLRGSQSDTLSLYKAEPFIGIKIYSQDSSNQLRIHSQLREAVAKLNEEAQGRFTLTLFEDQTQLLSNSLRDLGLFIAIFTLLSAGVAAYWMKQTLAGLVWVVNILLAISWMLAGYWLFGIGLNEMTLSFGTIQVLLFLTAGIVLFARYRALNEWNQSAIDGETKRVLVPVLVAQACLIILMVPLLYTDIIQSADKAAFYLSIPSFIWGGIGLFIVYGLIVPSVVMMLLQPSARPAEFPRGKLSIRLAEKWRRLCELRYMPYMLSLAATLLIVVFCKPFVITLPFTQLITNEMELSLDMVEGSTIETAFQTEKNLEEQLRKFPEVQDLYATVSKESMVLHLKTIDRYDRSRSKGEFDKALKDLLLHTAHTKNFELAGGEDQGEKVEFTVKGPILATTKQVADQLAFRVARYPLFTRLAFENPFITEVKTSYEGKLQQINFHPRADVLAKYSMSEDAVRAQIQSYLGEQTIGLARWGEQDTMITVKFPENAMQHPDQLQNLLVRTPEGAVPLKDLVDWKLAPSAEAYTREDGLYVISVTGKVNRKFTSAEGVYAALPRIKDYLTLPVGYSLLTGEDVRKQEKEKADEKDLTSRILISGLAVVLSCFLSALFLRRITPVVSMLLFVPLFASAGVLGLLIVDRPLTMMSMYGLIAVVGITFQLGLWLIAELERETNHAQGLEQARSTAVKLGLHPISAVLLLGLLAILPLTLGVGEGEDFHAPFAATFSCGILLAGWILLGLLPGIYLPLATSSLHEVIQNIGKLGSRVRIWWINERIRRQDSRSMKQRERLNQQKYEEALEAKQTSRPINTSELRPDDFLPLSK